LKIVHVNTYDLAGGAARSAFRLHQGLCREGHDSSMFVFQSSSNEPTVKTFRGPNDLWGRIRRRLKTKWLKRDFEAYQHSRPPGYEPFHDCRSIYAKEFIRQLPQCDIINLHWVADSFFDYRSFFASVPQRVPIVWTFHDMNAFTGGCHYDLGCDHYQSQCGSCPQLGSTDPQDLAFRTWQRKREAFEPLRPDSLRIVTPSHWLAEEALKSPLIRKFPVTVIPYGLDLDVFAPCNKKSAREVLGIPQQAKAVLFLADGMDNERKGFQFLAQALAGMNGSEQVANLTLISLGRNKPKLELTIPWYHLGFVDNERLLAAVYSAADLFVIPSLQDNLPNTVLEAMACGTPTVGFSAGGIPDMIRPGITGELVAPKDIKALSASILRLFNNPAQIAEMSNHCRRIVLDEYPLARQARRYADFYRELLSKRG
jgi:glycosyltransferase involved in cell wall biosynthesis